MSGFGLVDDLLELFADIARWIRSGRTTPAEVRARLEDLRARPPRPVNLSAMEEAIEARGATEPAPPPDEEEP